MSLIQETSGEAKPVKVFAKFFSKGAPKEVSLGYLRVKGSALAGFKDVVLNNILLLKITLL